MNEPHKPKLTDYLTEALAKSLTEEGRQSLLEERKLLEAEAQREQEERKLLGAEAQREQLEALQIQARPLDAPEVGEEAQTPPGPLEGYMTRPVLEAARASAQRRGGAERVSAIDARLATMPHLPTP